MASNRFFINYLVILIMTFSFINCNNSTEPPKENPPEKIKLFVNEFMASNRTTIADEKGQYEDWIELYNGEDTTIFLKYFYLTDDLSKKQKWNFPDTSILPKKWLLIWCDEDSLQGPLHANFKLSISGEQIGIFTFDGKAVDTLTYGPQRQDTSFGRFPDGADYWKFMIPTPNNTNR